MRSTRDAVIWRYVTLAILHSKVDRDDFAEEVARLYQARTPLDERSLKFQKHAAGTNPCTVRTANKQLLFRMLDPEGPVRMAAEIEEAVVLALPPPFRDQCQAELAARLGLMAAPLPAEDVVAAAVSCGELTMTFGECLQALAATIGDGHLDPSDAASAPEAIAQLDHLIALGTSLRAAHIAIRDGGTLPPSPEPPAPRPVNGATVHPIAPRGDRR